MLRQNRAGYRYLCVTVLAIPFLVGVSYLSFTRQVQLVSDGKSFGVTDCQQAKLPSPTEDDEEEVYRQRLQKYQDVCAVRRNSVVFVDKIFIYPNKKSGTTAGYCSVPKAGCTFWARIFQFLNRTETSRNVSSPFEISRYEIYFRPLTKLVSSKHHFSIMEQATRFFFVRDPYARLVSGFVDKFILPQFLAWNLYGHRIAKFRDNKTDAKQRCLSDPLSFKEFVNKLVLRNDRNLHWIPITRICDPCQIFPHFIGKQETFTKDAKYILKKVGLGDILTKYSHKTYVADEMNQLVDFTYTFRDRDPYLRMCFNNVAVADRLWSTFKINGYIKDSAQFPLDQLESVLSNVASTAEAKKVVTNVFIQENGKAQMSREEHTSQKRSMLLKLFAELSKESMEQIAEYYSEDFQMFGYEKYPRDLFPWRYE